MSKDKNDRPFGFVKTTLLGALLVVVPIGIVGFSLWQVARLVSGVMLPVFERLPIDSATIRVCVIVATLLIVVLLCYFTGLTVRTRWGGALRRWIERRLLEKIPGYTMIRSLTHQYLGHEDERMFRPVMVDLYDTGTKAIGFEIEELGDGTVAVFLPSAPAATLGQVHIVPEARVTPLKATVHATIEALAMYGVGSSKLVAEKQVEDGSGKEDKSS
jgi:uncharacterized membrane protein